VTCLSLLLAVGTAGAQTAVDKGKAVKPGVEKKLPPSAFQVQPERLTDVPPLKGHRLDEVKAILEKARLQLGAVAYANSDYPEGVVAAQNPEAGQRVFRGTQVAVTISRGPDTVPVPAVIGQPLSSASLVLAGAGFSVGDIGRKESEASAETVLDQHPEAGSKASRGSSVNLTIAVPITSAPTPANEVPSPGPEPATVPDLRGQSIAEAGDRLKEVGLRLGRQEEQESDEPSGRVLQQHPAPGTRAARGTPVDVTVSTSETATVPDLAGLGTDEARQRLTESGLTLGPVRDETSSDRKAGTVLRQDPGAETRVRRGTAVAVWMAVAPTKAWLLVTATILGAGVLAAEVYRRRVKRRQRRKDDAHNVPDLEIRAVQDQGKQRLSRSPAAVGSIRLAAHPDDGRQRVRFDSER
jgi:beta-lactam-binding protein with PASTA domain